MTNICEDFLSTVTHHPHRLALHYKEAYWKKLNWQDYAAKVHALIEYFQEADIQRGDRIAILADTSYQWAIIDWASLFYGLSVVPIYSNQSIQDIKYILDKTQVKMVFFDNKDLVSHWDKDKEQHPYIQEIISFYPIRKDIKALSHIIDKIRGPEILKDLKQYSQKIQSTDIATILFTSGTTGTPKGVVLSHAQITSEVHSLLKSLPVSKEDKSMLFLPLAHILARVELWAHAKAGFAIGIAESMGHLRSGFQVLRPTFFTGVPRVFEKIYNGVLAQAEASPLRMQIFEWTKKIGMETSEKLRQKQSIPFALSLKYKLAKKMVYDVLLQKLGGKIRFAISGGAPLSLEIAKFFHSSGILICEGYGLTETTAAVTLNTPYSYKLGSVGKALSDVEIKIDKDGEILVQSSKVTPSYLDKEDNVGALENGWLSTGDIGFLDADGFLFVTDRKKDLIKTSAGKYVAPQKLEFALRKNKYISNVLIHGDRKKYIVALICLEAQEVMNYLKAKNISYTGASALNTHPEVNDLIHEIVADVNLNLASYESIKRFLILSHDFSVENGELTPTLKVKRKFCDEKYKKEIASLYAPDSSYI